MGVFSNNADRKLLEARMRDEGRLPSGQVATLKWSVLHLGDIPRFDPHGWDFRTIGWVKKLIRLTWDEFMALTRVAVTADFHCVTRWSRFDNHWEGVSFRSTISPSRCRAPLTCSYTASRNTQRTFRSAT